ncbi:hypothetical protein [Streptomyces sp. UNOC14_S4]|uniref:hypothetical protein n=1 Tax=Streptomyces sp. UNOC14_S4 TaxID=2872340 RepID=UPI001E4A3666|nr:hypothetical protein [Streptomyces sp. UNOC14_S4]MCC3770739.1 hypothetical protein [Streptomyces sp. UNOC14_S4]
MDLDGARLLRGRLLNAGQGTEAKVVLPYEEAIRLALLIGFYEETWDANQVVDALHWWRALAKVLPQEQGWIFTLRDLEPMWIIEGQSGDFTAVHVVAEEAGRMYYQVTSHHDGRDGTANYADVDALLAAIAA